MSPPIALAKVPRLLRQPWHILALSHQQKVQELQTRRHEIEEMLRGEIIYRPRRC
jgi:hypothetical protein